MVSEVGLKPCPISSSVEPYDNNLSHTIHLLYEFQVLLRLSIPHHSTFNTQGMVEKVGFTGNHTIIFRITSHYASLMNK